MSFLGGWSMTGDRHPVLSEWSNRLNILRWTNYNSTKLMAKTEGRGERRRGRRKGGWEGKEMGMERRRKGRKEAHNANPQPPQHTHWSGRVNSKLYWEESQTRAHALLKLGWLDTITLCKKLITKAEYIRLWSSNSTHGIHTVYICWKTS